MSLAKRMADGETAKEQLEEIGEEIDEDTKKQIDLLIADGEKAKKSLAEANLRLVVSIAKRLVCRVLQVLHQVLKVRLQYLCCAECKYHHQSNQAFFRDDCLALHHKGSFL